MSLFGAFFPLYSLTSALHEEHPASQATSDGSEKKGSDAETTNYCNWIDVKAEFSQEYCGFPWFSTELPTFNPLALLFLNK